MNSADGAEGEAKPDRRTAEEGLTRAAAKPRVVNRRSVTMKKRGAAVSSADGAERTA